MTLKSEVEFWHQGLSGVRVVSQIGSYLRLHESSKESLDKQPFGMWAVCSGAQTLMFNKCIYRNFLKQLVELFLGLHSYLSLWVSWKKELCYVDTGGLQTYLSHVDTDFLTSLIEVLLRCFLPESLVAPITPYSLKKKNLEIFLLPHPLMQALTLHSCTLQLLPKCSFFQRLEFSFWNK